MTDMIVKDNKLAFVDSNDEVIYFLPRIASTDENKIVQFQGPPYRLGSNQITKDLHLKDGESTLFTADEVTIASGVEVTLDSGSSMVIIDQDIFNDLGTNGRTGQPIQSVYNEISAIREYTTPVSGDNGIEIQETRTSIKPKYNTSKIEVHATITLLTDTANIGYRVLRNGSVVGTNSPGTIYGMYAMPFALGGASTSTPVTVSFIYLDTPNTINTTEYSIQVACSHATTAANVSLNGNGNTQAAQFETGVSMIKLSEIYQGES